VKEDRSPRHLRTLAPKTRFRFYGDRLRGVDGIVLGPGRGGGVLVELTHASDGARYHAPEEWSGLIYVTKASRDDA